MLTTEYRKPAWFFYPGWVIASVVSIPIAWFIAFAILSQIIQIVGGTIVVGGVSHITEDFLFGFVLLPALGLVFGILQYLLLRLVLPRMGPWIAATVLGWVLPIAILSLAAAGWRPALHIDPIVSGAIGLGIIGACVGLGQWLMLRRRVHHTAWWILACVLGWAFAGMVSGESISNNQDIIAIALLPPIVACIAWWLLLDKYAMVLLKPGRRSYE